MNILIPHTLFLAVDLVFPSQPSWVSADSEMTTDVCLFDANQDGYLDMVFTYYRSDGLGRIAYFQSSFGSFQTTPTWLSVETAGYECVTCGDVDNDGDLDLVAGSMRTTGTESPIQLFENRGPGVVPLFSDASWESECNTDAYILQMIDIDSDGWLELLVANRNHRILIYENDTGQFAEQAIDCFEVASQQGFCFGMWPSIGVFSPILLCNINERVDNGTMRPDLALVQLNNGMPCMVWSNKSKSSVLYHPYPCDLDGDQDLDWFSFIEPSHLEYGLMSSLLSFSFKTITEEEIQGWPFEPVYTFLAASGAVVANIDTSDPSPEVIVSNRGIMDDDGWCLRNDMLLDVDNWSDDGSTADAIWTSGVDTSTLDVALGDLNRDGIQTVTVSRTLSIPNQSFQLQQWSNRIVSVRVGGSLVSPSRYHFDRESGILSLVGFTAGQRMTVVYETSSKLDLVCASVDADHIFLHQ